MQSQTAAITQDLVLLGGGHSHLFVLRHLAMNPQPGLRITLITRDVNTPYSGMLPGYIAGHYSFDETHIDLRPLAKFANANLIHSEIGALDVNDQRIHFADRPSLGYDLLSINIGSRPTVPEAIAPDAWQVAVKPVDQFLQQWQKVEQHLRERGTELRVAIVGGGAGGVELALSLQHRFNQMVDARGKLGLSLVTRSAELLVGHNKSVRAAFRQILTERAIPVIYNQKVTGFDGKQLHTESAAEIQADMVIWVTQAGAAAWLPDTGLALNDQGFIRVKSTLQSVSHDNVFAAGDIATVDQFSRPKSGVFAVRQGLPLAKNLLRYAAGETPRAFRPQRNFLSLISTGDQNAVASRGQMAMQGAWCWTWKDRIDRQFMDRFQQLPDMSVTDDVEPGVQSAMRCAGCGSKIGSGVLERVLQTLDAGYDPASQIEDAATLDISAESQLLQTVDYFRSFIDDLYVFGQIAALHALGDLFAMGVKPHSAQVLAAVQFATENKQYEDLLQLMSGVKHMLDAHSVQLLGGHSVEAEQAACGLSVNGFANPQQPPLSKGGLIASHRLLVLKPIGSGVLLAADMRARARGEWMQSALDSMLQSSWPAVDIIRQHHASACTDITGFGLAGHLYEMLRASGVSAEINLKVVPAMAGALELLEEGIESSLAPQNQQLERVVSLSGNATDSAYRLLFDPQTAGGLLVGLPAGEAEACLADLQSAGFTAAALIGKVVENSDGSGSRIAAR